MNERPPPPPLIPRLWATQEVKFLGRWDSFRMLLMHTGGGARLPWRPVGPTEGKGYSGRAPADLGKDSASPRPHEGAPGPQFSSQAGMRLAEVPGARHEGRAHTGVQMGTSGRGGGCEARCPSAVLTGVLPT